MWREHIRALFKDAIFADPVPPEVASRIDHEVGVAPPAELLACLAETNGVVAQYGSPILWPAEEIVAQNRLFRSHAEFADLYMPFDGLLFFGAAGGGDQYAYRVLDGKILDTSWIFKWDHESDNREWFARDLEDYFVRLKNA